MIDIIKGHFNELFGREDELSEERLAICRQCPLFNPNHPIKGMECNPALWISPETGEHSTSYLPGYVKGCGCRLAAKSRVEDAHCPAQKW